MQLSVIRLITPQHCRTIIEFQDRQIVVSCPFVLPQRVFLNHIQRGEDQQLPEVSYIIILYLYATGLKAKNDNGGDQ